MTICGKTIVPILITVLCCGAMFVYLNMRLAEVRNSVEKQNRVLTAFITNVQHDIRSGASASHLATPEAVAQAQAVTKLQAVEPAKLQDKIVVSDDEDDADSESSDSESSDSESECDDEERDENIVAQYTGDEGFKQISLELSSLPSGEVDIMALSFEILPNLSNDGMFNPNFSSSSSISEITEETLTINLEQNDKTEEESEPASYESMKVDELRKIVSDKNLSTKDEVKKLKKPELLLLLKK
jgi:hypothetical protein